MLYNPSEIYQKVISNELSKFEAIRNLLYLIEESVDVSLRVKSIEIIKELEWNNNKIYNAIEHSLISDENSFVRVEAAKVIFNKYLDIGKESLKHAIQCDNSTLVINTLINLIKGMDGKRDPIINDLCKAYSKRISQLSMVSGIAYEEIQFLIDIFDEINKIEAIKLDFELNFLHQNNFTCVIKENHIIAVSFSLRNSLPISIGALLKLELLDLSYNNLTTLPDSITNLSNLKTLDLSWNNLKNIPEKIFKLKALEFLNLSNNHIQKIPESLFTLKYISKIDLRNNNIQEIPKSIKSQKRNVRILIE